MISITLQVLGPVTFYTIGGALFRHERRSLGTIIKHLLVQIGRARFELAYFGHAVVTAPVSLRFITIDGLHVYGDRTIWVGVIHIRKIWNLACFTRF